MLALVVVIAREGEGAMTIRGGCSASKGHA